MGSNAPKILVVVLTLAAVVLWTQSVSSRDGRQLEPEGRRSSVSSQVEQDLAVKPATNKKARRAGRELALGETSVLLIVICNLRRDRLEHYGYDKPTSAIFKTLSSRSVVFYSHVAQASWTRPSLGSILTGHYPRHLALDNPGKMGSLERVLSDDFTTIAEIFGQQLPYDWCCRESKREDRIWYASGL